jgi:hypothetical protein
MVLVDTSVWIRFLAGRAPYATQLDKLLGLDEVTGHELKGDLKEYFVRMLDALGPGCSYRHKTGRRGTARWAEGCVALDSRGFVKTGADLMADALDKARWPLHRRPYLFETAARAFLPWATSAGAVNRVASVGALHRASGSCIVPASRRATVAMPTRGMLSLYTPAKMFRRRKFLEWSEL